MIASSLPHTVNVGGVAVAINIGHRAGIAFTSVLEDSSLSDEDKLSRALDIYYKDRDVARHDVSALIKAALDFYSYDPAGHYGRTRAALNKGGDKPRKTKQLISYVKDGALIYAAFMQQYGIDLADGELHWHKFRALLDGLTEDTQLVKVMRYRSIKLGDVSAEERKFYRDMQDFYSLEQISDAEAEQLSALEDKLMRAGKA